MTKLKVGTHILDITNEDKIYFPKITKGELIDYYLKISPYMLQHIKDRPLMLQRFPEGINGQSFFQKNTPDYFPSWIKTIEVPKSDGTTNFALCQNAATLVYLANFGTITFHSWLSRFTKLDYPDKLIFDLDPSTSDFSNIIKLALLLKAILEQTGLNPYVMTTGSHGMHVVCPIQPTVDFKHVKMFADDCSTILLQKYPELITLEIRKNKRGNKIFIDTLRNQVGATAAVPYTVRPYPKAPVATPLEWDELDNPKLTSSQVYNINTIFSRLEKMGDPWKEFFKKKKSLILPRKKLDKLIK